MRFEMRPIGPFMRDRSLHRGEIATDGAIRLMARHGASGVTLRALADEFNCTPQAVRQWFGGTDQMWQQIALRFGHRWVSSLTDLQRVDPGRARGGPIRPHHLLPFDAEDIAATRAWLSMTQLARDDETIGEALAEWEAREVEAVLDFAEHLDLDLDPINVDVLVAVVRGLRHAVGATHGPMALARAHAVLTRVIELLPRAASPRTAGDLMLF
jgi:AcrR family transcriptional regulator